MVRNWIRNVVNCIFVKQFIEYRCTLYLIKGFFVISYILVLFKNGVKTHNTVKPVYTGHSRQPENVPFIHRLKLNALFINGGDEAALYRQWFVI